MTSSDRPAGRTPLGAGDDPAAPRATRLTLGQRVLTALPRLQPRRAGAPGEPGPSAGGTGNAARSGAAKGSASTGSAASRPATKGTATRTAASGRPARDAASGARTADGEAGLSESGAPSGTGAAANGRGGSGANGKADSPANGRGDSPANGRGDSPANGRGDGTANGSGDGAAKARPLGSRLRDSLLKPPAPPASGKGGTRQPTKADPYPDKSSAELRTWIRTLDDRERLYTLIAAPLGAAVGIMGMVVTLERNPAVGVKGHQSPTSIALIGGVAIVLAVVALVSGLLRKRSFAAFSLMFLGFGASLGGGAFGSLPFLGLGMYLIFRSNKMQKALVSRGEHPRQQRSRAGGGGRAGAGGRGSASAGARSSSAAPRGRSTRRRGTPEPVGPAPNKRYTPPKPKGDEDR